MALNPIVFTEKVVRSFLRYQLTTYPFADERLHGQMRRLLSLDETRNSPLLKGPYISLSRLFVPGTIEKLVNDGVLHPLSVNVSGGNIPPIWSSRRRSAIRSVKTTLISTGRVWKDRCFLYPIISKGRSYETDVRLGDVRHVYP